MVSRRTLVVVGTSVVAALFTTWLQMFFSFYYLEHQPRAPPIGALDLFPLPVWLLSPAAYSFVMLIQRPPRVVWLSAVTFALVNVVAVATLLPLVHRLVRAVAGL